MATLAGAQAQSNAPFINPTKPTPEQMALAAARGLYTGQVLNFGESVRVSEMTDAPSGIVRKRLASDPYYDTINSSNRRPMRIADKSMEGKPDGALWSEQTRAPIRNLPNPATVQFDGISLTDTSAIGQGFLPPDTTGAGGPQSLRAGGQLGVSRLGPRGHGLDGDHSVFHVVRHADRLLPHVERRRSGRAVRPARRSLADQPVLHRCRPQQSPAHCHLEDRRPDRRVLPVRLPDAEQQVQRLPEVRSPVVTCA